MPQTFLFQFIKETVNPWIRDLLSHAELAELVDHWWENADSGIRVEQTSFAYLGKAQHLKVTLERQR